MSTEIAALILCYYGKEEKVFLISKRIYEYVKNNLKEVKFRKNLDIDLVKMFEYPSVTHIVFTVNPCEKLAMANLNAIPDRFIKLESLKIKPVQIQDLESFSKLQSPSCSDCVSTFAFNDKAVSSVQKLSQLTSLSLPGGRDGETITDEGLDSIVFLRKLKKLNLSSNACITDIGLNKIKRLPNLTHLNLSFCEKMTPIWLKEICSITQLACLYLEISRDTEENDITDQSLQHLTNLKALKELNLANQSQITDQVFTYLGELKNLTSLNVEGCWNVKDDGLVFLSGLSKLNKLDLSGCSIEGKGLKDLSETLEELDISNCPNISDNTLKDVSRFTHLKKLNLRNCSEITKAGLIHLAKLTDLETLNLSSCGNIDSKGLTYLSHFHKLKELDVSGCDIAEKHLEMIANLAELEKLSLRSCHLVTDKGLKNLTKLQKLRNLDLHFCRTITGESLLSISLLQNLSHLNLENCLSIELDELQVLSSLSKLKKLFITSFGTSEDDIHLLSDYLKKFSDVTIIHNRRRFHPLKLS